MFSNLVLFLLIIILVVLIYNKTQSTFDSGVSSPALPSDPVKIYKDKSEKGTSASFSRPGDFVLSSNATGVSASTVSSINVAPGWTLSAFSKTNFTGNRADFSSSNASSFYNTFNDKAKSIRITGPSYPSGTPVPGKNYTKTGGMGSYGDQGSKPYGDLNDCLSYCDSDATCKGVVMINGTEGDRNATCVYSRTYSDLFSSPNRTLYTKKT